MKKFFLLIIASFLLGHTFAQNSYSWCEAYIGVIPEKPTIDDEVYINTRLIAPDDSDMREILYSVNLENIVGNEIYLQGRTSVDGSCIIIPGDRYYTKNYELKSVSLGKLPMGDYVVHLTIKDDSGPNFDNYEDLNLTFEFSVQKGQTSIVDNQRKHQKILISPNPLSTEINLVLSKTQNEIQIFDMQGKVVLQTECGETATINVSMLPKGVYSIIVNNTASQTFIKQ